MRARLGRLDGVVGVLVVVAAGLRIWGLGRQSFWYDEWSSTQAVAGSPADLVRYLGQREGSPPGYFVLLWVWERLFGSGEVALRSLSVVAGVATVPLVYAAVLSLGQSRRSARVAALLVTVHPALVWYSQEARPYSLLGCAAAVSLWGFGRVWQSDGDDRTGRLVWGAACVALVALHWFGAFLVVAELGALLVLRPADRRRVLLAAVPSGVTLVALVPVALEQRSHEANSHWITDFALRTRLGEAGRSALTGPAAPDDAWWAIAGAAVLVAVVLFGFRGSATDRRTALVMTAVGSVGVLLPILLAASGIQDSLISRYLIAAFVPLVVAAAIALGSVPRWIGLGALGVVGVLALASVQAVPDDPDLHKPDWRAVADVFDDRDGERLLVLNLHRVMTRPLETYTENTRILAADEVSHAETIDVVSTDPTDDPCNFLVGHACSLIFLGGPLPAPLAERVSLIDRVVLDQFTIDRYRVDDPDDGVTAEELVAPGQLPGALVLVAGD